MSAMNFMAGLKAEASSTSVRFSKPPPSSLGKSTSRCLGFIPVWTTGLSFCTSHWFPSLLKRVKICVSLCKATQDVLLESVL